MRSLVWSAIFSLLMMELVVVAVLAIPVPRRWRNWICMECSKLDLKKQMQPVLTAIGVGLVIAIVDSVNSLLLILDFVREDNHEENFIVRHLDKEKEYRTERNLYLAAFALTLLLVIGRLTDLMQEHADLEDDLARLKSKIPSTVDGSTTDSSTGATEKSPDMPSSEIEMKPIQSKKKD